MSSYKNNEELIYSKNCKLLIKSVTNFSEDENFKASYEYLISTLLYHPYREANSHEVRHKIAGLYEKYIIQSDHEKARLFKRITDNLINFYNNKDTSVKEQGYRILALIFHLAGTGNSNNFPEAKNSTSFNTETANFDWVSYLKEDVNYNFNNSDSETFTPDASTEEPFSSEDDSLEDLPDAPLRPPPRDDSGLGISPDSCSGASQLFQVATVVAPEMVPSCSRTEKHGATFYPYWMEEYQKMYGSSPYNLKSMNFTRIWNEYLASQNLYELIDKKVVMHERNVIKEIIWMFSGVQDLFIVHWSGEKFEPNSKIHLSNLTSNTLRTFLNEFCTYATKKQILHNHSKYGLGASADDCLTFRAYRNSFRDELQRINDAVCDMDKMLRKGDETFTLLILHRKMKPVFHQINVLYEIYKEVSSELSNGEEVYVKACRLLQILWKLLLYQSFQEHKSDTVKIFLRMFLKSCKPYFTFLENLTILGSFDDHFSEFIIRKRDLTVEDEIYWDMSLEIQYSLYFEKDFFMNPFLTDIVSAGKSLEILKKIKSSLKTEAFRLDAEQGDLYFKFLQILQRYICPRNSWLNVPKEVECKLQEYSRSVSDESDPLLEQRIFEFTGSNAKFFQPDEINPAYRSVCQKPFTNSFTWQQEMSEKIIQTMDPNCLKPATASITKALKVCTHFAYYPICQQLMRSFKEDYDILRHMAVMRKYFLMEAGDLMYSFYSEIFWKIFRKESWRDISFLYSVLQNAIFEDKINCGKLYIYLTDPTDKLVQPFKSHQNLNHLGTFQLSYKVNWPVTMMLGTSTQNEYSQIFTFLLQIKCAKFLLDNLHSLSLCKQEKKSKLTKAYLQTTVPREQKMHGMYIIRMRLMFFVNGLHNYIMTRILHKFGVEFHDSLEKAETFEEMIRIHKGYLKSLSERCLLDRRVSYIKEYIFEVLNLCHVFQQLWLKGADEVSVEELLGIENHFSKISNILTCCFTKPLRRGTDLQFESLSSTMIPPTHSLHVFCEENC